MSLPDTPLGTRHASLSTCTPLPRVCALEVQLSRLTIVGGVRERSVVTRRGRGKTVCARGAYWALLCSPSTSPLECRESSHARHFLHPYRNRELLRSSTELWRGRSHNWHLQQLEIQQRRWRPSGP